MNPSQLKDNELLSNTKNLAQQERKIQVELLHHLLEIDDRKLYLRIGFGSLFDYVVKELNYSESSAYRRIQAMRLLRSVPEVDQKILKGEVNLTSMAQVQGFVKAEHKRGQVVSMTQKTELISAIENRSTRDVQRYLLSLNPEVVLPEEKVRAISADHTEIKIVIDEDFRMVLEKLKALLSHVNPEMSYTELYKYLAKKALKQLDKTALVARAKRSGPGNPSPRLRENEVTLAFNNKKRRATPAPKSESESKLKSKLESESASELELGLESESKSKSESELGSELESELESESKLDSDSDSDSESTSTSTSTSKSSTVVVDSVGNTSSRCLTPLNAPSARMIPKSIQREVWRRDAGCCSYTDPKTHRKCGSRFQVQIDHIKLFSRGGTHEIKNLRLLCASHNRARSFLEQTPRPE